VSGDSLDGLSENCLRFHIEESFCIDEWFSFDPSVYGTRVIYLHCLTQHIKEETKRFHRPTVQTDDIRSRHRFQFSSFSVVDGGRTVNRR